MASPARLNTKKRLVYLFAACGVIFLLLAIRIGWIMIVDGDEYSNLALEQQTRDTRLTADRGTIYDCHMKELAVNAPSYTVYARPAEITDKNGDVNKMAEILAKVTGEDKSEILEELQEDKTSVKIAKSITLDQANELRKYMTDYDENQLPGISLDETSNRYYPYGDFASMLIGHTNDSGNGVSGVEQSYNDYLSGTSGRLIRNTDVTGRKLSYGKTKYYEAEDGLNLVLTVDEALQHYMEEALENACVDTSAKRSAGIAMDPNTGEILAMAVYPGYDLNDPNEPVTEEGKEEYDDLKTNEEQVNYLNEMWSDFLISETYEPGSTFKLITTSIALEEGLTSTSETFNCSGYYRVYDQVFKFWSYKNPHGYQTLAQAIQHSCNPVQIELALRIGATKYYEYLDALGYTSKTGIDLPGESKAITYDRENINPAELAAMSYGQGISVTPIQMVTAISAIANGGNVIKPHVVKEIQDSNGDVIYTSETKAIRKVYSEETSKEMCAIMQSVVDEGTGKKGYIAGYRVGGKTGTADKVVNGKYVSGKVYSSFVAIAPSDDPQIIVLFVVDEPVGAHYASTIVVPYVREFLENALPYMQVEPEYTADELASLNAGSVSVTNVTGKTVADAKTALSGQGLKVSVVPGTADDDDTVVDQYPKYGDKTADGSTVYIYTK